MAHAQYYYNDIVANQQTNTNYKQLRSNKIRKVKAISKDANNEVAEGFSVLQELSSDGKTMTTATSTSDGVSSELTSYYENGRISKTEERSVNVTTTVDYVYDEAGKLQSIASVSFDTTINGYQSEMHVWQYNSKGQPEQMLKIKNGTDTTRIILVYDEKGNPGIEQWRKRNKANGVDYIKETYYYYFDASNRVTDIVRYNQDNGKMLPDCLYEYDADGKLTKMTQVRTGGSNYLVWKYSYNEKGFKAKEVCFDKARHVLGFMEYTYN